MIKISEWDDKVPFFSQLNQASEPVTLIIQFNVAAHDEQQFLSAWRDHGLCMAKFPGYRGEQLHNGLGASNVYVNYSTWGSVAQFAAAFSSPESQACVNAYPDDARLAGHLLVKVAVADVCGGQ